MVKHHDQYWLFWATEAVAILASSFVVTYCNVYCRHYEMFSRGWFSAPCKLTAIMKIFWKFLQVAALELQNKNALRSPVALQGWVWVICHAASSHLHGYFVMSLFTLMVLPSKMHQALGHHLQNMVHIRKHLWLKVVSFVASFLGERIMRHE